MRVTAERKRLADEFLAADKIHVRRMPDAELAAWQAQFPKESPQFILGEQLWRYRLARRSAIFGAAVAVLSGLTGAVVGYALRAAQPVTNDCAKEQPKQDVPPPVAGKISDPPPPPAKHSPPHQ